MCNKNSCQYFPCHSGIPDNEFDCRFCYCPFYEECSARSNFVFGGYWLPLPDNGRVFACEKCIVAHIKKNADFIEKLIKQGKMTNDILDALILLHKQSGA